jgi:hypothetical protein
MQQGKSELVLQKILSIGLCFLSRDSVWVYKKANVNVATAYRFLRLEFLNSVFNKKPRSVG